MSLLAVMLVSGGILTVPEAQAATVAWVVQPSPNRSGCHQSFLNGVAATSAHNAWAVGGYCNNAQTDQTLVEHWDGTAWVVQPSPNPGGSSHFNVLNGVAATSATNAWAVGNYDNKAFASQTLVERWHGTAWKVQASPNPAGSRNENFLNGVAATSATNAWAVGDYWNKASVPRTLIDHWDGTAWKVQPSPNPGGSSNDNILYGVAATSATNAWAVGTYTNVKYGRPNTLIEHWDGTAWKVQPSPNPGGRNNDDEFFGVAATSATNAWAVGVQSSGLGTLIEHWDGTAWKVQPSPNVATPGNENLLNGVAATSATNAWAVGTYYNGNPTLTLVEHWDGTAWKVQTSPSPGGSSNYNALNGVAATSATNAWAVGVVINLNRPAKRTIVEHCC